jgi:hypothetical protein
MRPKGIELTRGRVEGQDLKDLENLLSQRVGGISGGREKQL